MSLEQYPLTVGPNMTQLEAMTLFGDDIDDSEFTTPAFSEAFEAKYGNPVPWPRAWKRLMAVTFDKSLAPKYTGKVLFVADNISFMDFCKASDFAAVTKGVRVLGRQELEGAWVQELVYKFDKIKPADLQELLGQFRVLSLEDAASLMKQRLREAVKKVNSTFPNLLRYNESNSDFILAFHKPWHRGVLGFKGSAIRCARSRCSSESFRDPLLREANAHLVDVGQC